MVKLLLGLATLPSPYDAADALAVALCHCQILAFNARVPSAAARPKSASSWRNYKPARS